MMVGIIALADWPDHSVELLDWVEFARLSVRINIPITRFWRSEDELASGVVLQVIHESHVDISNAKVEVVFIVITAEVGINDDNQIYAVGSFGDTGNLGCSGSRCSFCCC